MVKINKRHDHWIIKTRLFLQNYSTKPSHYYFLWTIEMGYVIYNSSSLLNLTITVTTSYVVFSFCHPYSLQLFDALLRQKYFNKALVYVCWISSKITVHEKCIGKGIFPVRGLPVSKSPIVYIHKWPVLKVMMITIVL